MKKITKLSAKGRLREEKRRKAVNKLIVKLLRLLIKHYGAESGEDVEEMFQQIREVNESVEIMAREFKRQADAKPVGETAPAA